MSNHSPKNTPQPKLRHAAVLIPVLQHQGEWQLLFIVRAKNKLDPHSGQVAFPGGGMEAIDQSSGIANALRETFEEIGIPSDQIQTLHELPAYITNFSNYSIAPVVGLVNWPTTITLQEEEVSRVFTIPLNWLRDKNNYTLKSRADIDKSFKGSLPETLIVYQQYDGEVLWGATAQMTHNFIDALNNGDIQLPTTS